MPHCSQLLVVILVVSCVNGGPPAFIQQPGDVIVVNGRLLMNCSAGAGNAPPPYINWYRGNPPLLLQAFSGLSILNITNATVGVDATTGGVPYHCRASNGYGTIRSRDALAYIAVFDGFQNERNVTVNVENTTVQSYPDTVALYCNVSRANPPPAIVWVNDLGQVVPNGGTTFVYVQDGRYLVVLNVGAVLAQRTFHCRVTNALGSRTIDSTSLYRFNLLGADTSSTQLRIYKPLEDVTAYEGDTNVKFSMVATSTGTTVFTYYITSVPEGSSLATGPLILQSAVLGVIQGPVSVKDNGTIVRCLVNFFPQGQAMVAQYTATLTVIAAPFLISGPNNSLNNFQGDIVTFSCVYLAAMGITLTWYKDGAVLGNTSRLQIAASSLSIASQLVNDSGMYQCSVSNGSNSVWWQWAVGVRIPVLKLQPQSLVSPLVKPVGSNVTLTLQVQADPPANVLWYFNGSVIQTNNVYQITTIPADNTTGSILYNTSLAIYSLDLSTQGYYFASFSAKTVLNSSAVFVTPEVAAQVLSIATPTCLTLGTALQVACVAYGYPIPSVQFVRNNGIIRPSDGRASVTNSSLTITNTTPDDVGLYCCQASNGLAGAGPTLACSSVLSCGYPVVTIAATSVILGSSVNLSCSDDGSLPSNFTWAKGHNPITEDLHLSIVTVGRRSSLVFRPLTEGDRGTYTCVVTNLVGSSAHTYTLSAQTEILPSYGVIIFIAAASALVLLVPVVGVACYFNGRSKTARYNLEAHKGTEGVANVDKSSVEGEAFNPVYDSLPVSEVRPAEPPVYIPAPAYALPMKKKEPHSNKNPLHQSAERIHEEIEMKDDITIKEPTLHGDTRLI